MTAEELLARLSPEQFERLTAEMRARLRQLAHDALDAVIDGQPLDGNAAIARVLEEAYLKAVRPPAPPDLVKCFGEFIEKHTPVSNQRAEQLALARALRGGPDTPSSPLSSELDRYFELAASFFAKHKKRVEDGKRSQQGKTSDMDLAAKHRKIVERAAADGLSQRQTEREFGFGSRETVRKHWPKKK